jgi:Uma2 family endonuclease
VTREKSMIAEPYLQRASDEDLYPTSDGLPMAETGIHAKAMALLHDALEDFLPSRNSDAYVAIDMFWYWEKGVPKSCKAPDLMVFMDAGNHLRRSFRSWEEGGRIADFIVEMASENTWKDCVEEKKETYRRLGVKEYFVFDPLVEFLDPPLRGYRLANDYSDELDVGEGLRSDVLEAQLVVEGTMLRLVDLRTGQNVLTRLERVEDECERANQEHERAEQERERAEQEREKANQERERAEQERERADDQAKLAEQERERADDQAKLAEQERERADALESELTRLRELLKQSGKADSTSKDDG